MFLQEVSDSQPLLLAVAREESESWSFLLQCLRAYAEKLLAMDSAQTAKRLAAREKSGKELSDSLAWLQINCLNQ